MVTTKPRNGLPRIIPAGKKGMRSAGILPYGLVVTNSDTFDAFGKEVVLEHLIILIDFLVPRM